MKDGCSRWGADVEDKSERRNWNNVVAKTHPVKQVYVAGTTSYEDRKAADTKLSLDA